MTLEEFMLKLDLLGVDPEEEIRITGGDTATPQRVRRVRQVYDPETQAPLTEIELENP